MRVSYVWHDHECYLVTLDGTLVGMLFKTFEGYWTFRRYEVEDDELQAFLDASFPASYYEKLIIAKREISKKLRGWCR